MVAVLCGVLLSIAGCTSSADETDRTVFERVPPASSNIDFSNELAFKDAFNIFTYTDYYAGGGVALGDINNDGLLDVYLVANQKSNRLYLNRGDFEFQDITEKAAVGGKKPWSTGVSMVDVNADGLLDIYVANAGAYRGEGRTRDAYRNELFINNGDLTFSERAAEYGIDDAGNSIHAAFFDYDRDGDLDMYLLNNHNSKPIGQYDLQYNQRDVRDFRGGDRLYRNELVSDSLDATGSQTGSASFTDVTEQANIYSSEIGFGLGASVGDINRDGWMDIYVSNDFFERDYLYINNRDGTFREALEQHLSSISTSSMGGDIADLNNDGLSEIFITDMLPGSEQRLKTMADFIRWERLQSEIDMGYYRKFLRNTLQYNNGDGTFSEIGRYAGVAATDWSWGAVIADFDADGLRDIFVPNGVYKDETNKDYLVATSKREVMKKVVTNNRVDYRKLLEMIPSNPLSNYMFENSGGMRFTDRADDWGLGERSFSNGAAYGDLDRDGDLDLVVNNLNMESFVYRNRTMEARPDSARHRGWLQVALEGEAPNTYGVGAQVELAADGQYWYAEQMPQRGYQSSMDPVVHVGLGVGVKVIDTLQVVWPDGRVSLQTDVETGQRLVVQQSGARDSAVLAGRLSPLGSEGKRRPLLTDITDESGIDWNHQESSYNDFEESPLLLHMRSTEGPPLCTADMNGDAREDLFVGGAKDQPGALFVQGTDGRFNRTRQPALEDDAPAEDTECTIFDADGDGRAELYVASGSSEFAPGDQNLADRLYRVEGSARLRPVDQALPGGENRPVATGAVRPADIDGDGDQDLFVGMRMGSKYGNPVGAAVLENDGTGQFTDATKKLAPQLQAHELNSAGITDAVWGDLNEDGSPDLVLAGEWMPLTVFFNENGTLVRADPQTAGLDNTRGWWHSLALADLDGDGSLDLVGGNHGLNSRFQARPDRPVKMWAGDFSGNGSIEQILGTYNEEGGPYPVALRQHLMQVIPNLKSRYSTFAEYADEPVTDMFSRRQFDYADEYGAEQLASVVAINNGDGSFKVDSLPFRAQLSPMYGILVENVDETETPEILMGGNLYDVQPQAGRYDASYGILLRQDIEGTYHDMSSRESGFFSEGEIRSIRSVNSEGRTLVIVARNDDRLQVFQVTRH